MAIGHAGRDNYVCLNCGAMLGHKGRCDQCGANLKADRLLTEEDLDRLAERQKRIGTPKRVT